MIKKWVSEGNLFCSGKYAEFNRDGQLIGRVINNKVQRIRWETYRQPVELTRAQGYKYWKRYFPNRLIWDLPEALQEAIESESRSYGTYVNRQGEVIGYEG